MKCPDCGASLPPEARRCEYCGSTAPERVHPPSSRAGDFHRILQSSAYANRNAAERLEALPKLSQLEAAIPIVFFCIFIGASILIGLVMLFVFPCAAIVPAGFVVVGVMMMIRTTEKMKERAAAPVLARAAIVTGKRTSVSGGRGNSSASTHYFATFELEDGSRHEYIADNALYGRLAESDAGVLFTRADLVVAFDRAG